MTNASFSPYDRDDRSADPTAEAAKTPAHRARRIAAAVSAGAFAGIAIGLVATQAGADDDPAPTSADAGVLQQSPLGRFGGSDTQDLDGDGRPGDVFGDGGSTDQFGGSTDQFSPPSAGGATPAPFGGQTAPDTNSGGS